MKLWPYDRFVVDIPRPPEQVLNALTLFAMADGGRETLQYKPMCGTVTGSTFEILPRGYPSVRSPKAYFFGQVAPHGDGSRVTVTLRFHSFVLWFYAVVPALLLCVAGYLYLTVPSPPDSLFFLWPSLLLWLSWGYVAHMIDFWSAQTRKKNLINVMTYFGMRAQID